METISQILETLPLLLQYYLPGFWTITVFKYFCSKELEKGSQTIMSCVISYVLLANLDLLANIPLFDFVQNSVWKKSGMAVIVGTVLALAFSWIFNSRWFSWIMVKMFHKTPNDNIWRDILDLSNGSNLKLYIREADYYVIGHHRNIEEKGDDSWIVLTGFIKCGKANNKEIESHEESNNDMIAIRLADVEYVEIYD